MRRSGVRSARRCSQRSRWLCRSPRPANPPPRELSQSGKPALPADVSELLIPPYSRLPRKQKAEIAAQLMLIAERQWWASAKIYLDYCYEKTFEEKDGQAQPSS